MLGSRARPVHTITALKRWSCDNNDAPLPPAATIKAIHVYDFDNTLFASPLPNKALWNSATIGQLGSPDIFVNGGWWHDAAILGATGLGVDEEEKRGWKGWWNELIVSLVEQSMAQKDALNVLLTGRSEPGFADLIRRIVRSRRLEFDLVCLKPTVGPAGQAFRNTLDFKQELLKDIVYTYRDATEIRVYEDRVKHTKAFRDFFFSFNKDLLANPQVRASIVAEVIQVPENATQLDPVTEIAEVQKLINAHNTRVKEGTAPGAIPWQIKKTVFYTGYMLTPAVSDKLAQLVRTPNPPDGDVRYLANSILITPKPCPRSILDKVGGIGAKLSWKVTGTACFENKLWAARVEPVPKHAKYYSENPTPTVVLAIRKNGRPADAARITNWHPVPDSLAFTFESTVGEKQMLRIEEETPGENTYESFFSKRKRSLQPDEERQRPHPQSNARRGGGNRNGDGGGHNSRGRGRSQRGRGRASRGRGRGNGQYRSLDDVGGHSTNDGPDAFY